MFVMPLATKICISLTLACFGLAYLLRLMAAHLIRFLLFLKFKKDYQRSSIIISIKAL
jgi:hypothetical protein